MIRALLFLHVGLAALAITCSVLAAQARLAERTRALGSSLLGVVVLQSLLGDVLYPTYLRTAKPALVALRAGGRSPADVFDVKEHLAFFALVVTIGAFLLTRTEPKPNPFLRTLFGSAHGLIVLVATLGLVVASLRTP